MKRQEAQAQFSKCRERFKVKENDKLWFANLFVRFLEKFLRVKIKVGPAKSRRLIALSQTYIALNYRVRFFLNDVLNLCWVILFDPITMMRECVCENEAILLFHTQSRLKWVFWGIIQFCQGQNGRFKVSLWR